MNRFFVDKHDIVNDKALIIDREEVKHITKVLRLKEGDLVEISDGEVFEYLCEISNIDNDVVETKVLTKSKTKGEPSYKIKLFQGMPKQGKLDLIVQKSVELGVCEITPVYMDRCVSIKNAKEEKKVQRQNAIALSAAKQSKRGTIPIVNTPQDFKDIINELKKIDLVIFPYESAEDITIKELLKAEAENINKTATIGILIGPEGGFSDNEVQILQKEGIKAVTLGSRILRTETASAAVLSMILYELEL